MSESEWKMLEDPYAVRGKILVELRPGPHKTMILAFADHTFVSLAATADGQVAPMKEMGVRLFPPSAQRD